MSQLYRTAIGLLVFAFLISVLAAPFKSAQAQESHRIVVKLQQGVDASVLSQYGPYKHLFAQNPNQEFSNIYQLTTELPAPELKNILGPQAIYAEDDQAVLGQQIALNDPGFTTNADDIDRTWGLARANFLNAWDKTVGTKKTVVAIIDTGVDGTHEDLQLAQFVDGFDFINSKALSGNINSDDNGHGTMVAGVLAAAPNNGKGLVGTAWFVSIMPLKALDSSGKGDSSDIAQAIVWAADHGADIINLSLGGVGFGHDTTLANSIRYAFNKNVVLIAAAGNDVAVNGGNLDKEPVFPVCNDNDQNMIIGVAALDASDRKASFSNYGKNCIDVSAPGKRILSTINFDPITNVAAPNSYAYGSGTSLAVPFVTGEAALIKSKYPNATNIEIRDRIVATTDPVDGLNPSQCNGAPCDGMLGTGRINAARSLEQELGVSIKEGDVVKTQEDGTIYQISGGQKRKISTFVLNQRFSGVAIKTVNAAVLNQYPSGPYAMPVEGTLVKAVDNSTVYQISQGLKLPVTGQVFKQRRFQFSNISMVGADELNSWTLGNFLSPTEGTLVRGQRTRTVYWVVGGLLHPVNLGFYNERGLRVFPVIMISEQDLASYAKGEAYIR